MRFTFFREGLSITGEGTVPNSMMALQALVSTIGLPDEVQVSDQDATNFSLRMAASGSASQFEEAGAQLVHTVLAGNWPCWAFVPLYSPEVFISDVMTLWSLGFEIK